MGFFDSIKSAFSGGEEEKDSTVGPSQLLREAGIDPSGLKFGFGTGKITVSGTIDDEADRAKILEVLNGIESISEVEDHILIAPPAKPAPEPSVEAPVEPEAPAEPAAPSESAGTDAPAADAARTYTVESGDSLWKIAEDMYGSGAKYTQIFEANRDILDDPDRIFPGQVLKIPDLDD
jgi:nucleoid-associated protein YgaU